MRYFQITYIRAFLLPAFIVLCGGLLTFHTIVSTHDQDVAEYYQKSLLLLNGKIPYRDFVFEYPLLAFVPMLVPRLVAAGAHISFSTYAVLFLIENAVLAGALGVCVDAVDRRLREVAPSTKSATVSTYAILLACTCIVAPWRFDLFSALLTAVSLLAFLNRKDAAAGALLASGVAVKLYPALLLPVLLRSGDRRSAVRCAAAFLSTLLVAVVLSGLWTGFANSTAFLRYHAHRGIQIESTAAGLLFAAHGFGSTRLGFVYDFGAYHLAFAGSATALRILTALMAVLLAFALWIVVRCRRCPLSHFMPRASLLLLLAFIIANKVFSIQYVIWLMPFAALLDDKRDRNIGIALFALTAVEIVFYSGLLHFDPLSIAVLNLRNLAAVILFVSAAWSLMRPPASTLTSAA